MVIEFLISVFTGMFSGLFSMLPSNFIEIPSFIYNGFNSLVSGVGYFLPIPQLIPLLVIQLSIIGFKIALAIILRVKSFIPTMGN